MQTSNRKLLNINLVKAIHSSSHQVVKVLEFQPQHQSFQLIFMTDFHSDRLVGSLLPSKGLSRVFPTPQFKSINSSALSLLHSPTFTSIPHGCNSMTTGKTIALTRRTFVGKIMSLLLNMVGNTDRQRLFQKEH